MADIRQHFSLPFRFIVESHKLNMIVIVESDNLMTAQTEANLILERWRVAEKMTETMKAVRKSTKKV